MVSNKILIMKYKFPKYLLILLSVLCYAQIAEAVTVKISDGIQNPSVQSKIENKLSQILTDINNAYENENLPPYSQWNLGAKGEDAQTTISILWENTPFFCIDDEVVEKGLRTASGKYQVRNIPLMLKNVDDGDDDYQEAVATFDANGNLETFNLTIASNIYGDIIQQQKDVTDLRHREMILDWTERFRTAYNKKDLGFIEQVFSDNALIITGKQTSPSKGKGDMISLKGNIEYIVQNKKEYITRLANVFRNNKFISVNFNDIKVMSHPNPEYNGLYGVTLEQDYKSSGYSDEGYLFLLWDFRDEDEPKIHVRVWQPEDFEGGADGPFKFVDL